MRRALASTALFLALAGCNAATPDNAAVCSLSRAGRSHVEVVASGTIDRLLGTREGRSGAHEGYLLNLDSDCALRVKVETNVDITGPMVLHPGEHAVVKGEYEYNVLGGVIHWTHRELHGYHAGGFVTVGGRTYE